MKPFIRSAPAEYEDAALAGAEGAVTDLVGRIASWETEAGAAETEAEELHGQLGGLMLDDPAAAAQAVEGIARLRTKATAARAAVGEASRRLDTARRAVLLVRAGQLRSRAVVLRANAVERQRKTDGMLAALAAHEGVAFGPKPGDSPTHGIGRGITPYTRSQRMGQEADRLDRLAVEQEQRAQAGTPDEVAAATSSDAVPIGPLERDLVAA